MRRYLSRLCDTPAPSTAASAFRTPVLKALLREDGALGMAGLHLREDFENTGSTVLITGTPEAAAKKLWYFAHLDTISYLVQPRLGDGYPLVPFCYHLMKEGVCAARAYRFDLAAGGYVLADEGELRSKDGHPSFHPARAARISARATGSCRSRPIARIRRAAPSSATWTMRAASRRSRSRRRSWRKLASRR